MQGNGAISTLQSFTVLSSLRIFEQMFTLNSSNLFWQNQRCHAAYCVKRTGISDWKILTMFNVLSLTHFRLYSRMSCIHSRTPGPNTVRGNQYSMSSHHKLEPKTCRRIVSKCFHQWYFHQQTSPMDFQIVFLKIWWTLTTSKLCH